MKKGIVACIVLLLASSPCLAGTKLLLGVGNPPAAAPAGYSGPGDIVASAVAWWGMRAYSAATAGNNAITVTRTSDSANQILTTNATTGALDTATATTFCNATTCKITKWFDQTGNGHDLTNGSAATSPTFTFSCIGSLPCATFAAGTIDTGASITQAQPITVSALIRSTSAAAVGTFFNVPGQLYFFFDTTPHLGISNATNFTVTTVNNTWYALQGVLNGASSVSYLNGSSNSGSAGVVGISSTPRFGTDEFAENFTGNIFELGFWASAFNGTQNANMDSNQRTYCGC